MAVNQVSRLLGKIRRAVSFFHRSTTTAHVLEQKQEMLHLPKHRLINDVATRWNSSYEMVERYLEQQSVYSALSALKNKDIANLTDQEDFLHKCTALDPRFKTLPHLDRASHLRIYGDLIIPEVLSRAEHVETTEASPATTSQATSLPATAESAPPPPKRETSMI
ncbi:hypothetical protein KUCAC02_017918 [Chaenocephalus aceratus]|uniref:Uncharacterized protein n=1 Tax=Chaenocephalus aceratus TaxID=36190 RepID=A0ACB9W7V3_CHAAC|nr:hypothetical protein KUCAC02_017918 [Chaenocephalus aceratus]